MATTVWEFVNPFFNFSILIIFFQICQGSYQFVNTQTIKNLNKCNKVQLVEFKNQQQPPFVGKLLSILS
jgi:hypothetical protein